MNYIKLGREISCILRHNPEEYNLKLDDNGFIGIDLLLDALNKRNRYNKVITLDNIKYILDISEKKRWEIVDNKIRAYYGHSFNNKIKFEEKEPPIILYHGTYNDVLDNILNEGLKPMQRQYVHLSETIEMAKQVGKRRDNHPVILAIDSSKAFDDGIKFYYSTNGVWLVDYMPPNYLSVIGRRRVRKIK